MIKYSNTGRDTGVIACQPGTNSISIKFRDGSTYLYTAESAGVEAINVMKLLALKGEGLTTYINQHVKDKYQAKLK